jgi:hypothetical protein
LTGNQSICSWNAKSSRELFPIRNESMTVIARKENRPRFAESLQESSPNRVPANEPRSARIHSRRRAARRRVPSDPLEARGGTDSALIPSPKLFIDEAGDLELVDERGALLY